MWGTGQPRREEPFSVLDLLFFPPPILTWVNLIWRDCKVEMAVSVTRPTKLERRIKWGDPLSCPFFRDLNSIHPHKHHWRCWMGKPFFFGIPPLRLSRGSCVWYFSWTICAPVSSFIIFHFSIEWAKVWNSDVLIAGPKVKLKLNIKPEWVHQLTSRSNYIEFPWEQK